MKNDNQIKEDINGRMHSLDQGFRSLEKRLRAVERRLSAGDVPGGLQPVADPDTEREIDEIRTDILTIRDRLDRLTGSGPDRSLGEELDALRQQVLEMGKHIGMLTEENSKLHSMLEKFNKEDQEPKTKPDLNDLHAEFSEKLTSLSQRLDKAENHNRLHIGSMKVPLEMSGIAGALILTLTGGLILAGRWDIIRSPYFSFGVAFTLALAVLVKFYFANSSKA